MNEQHKLDVVSLVFGLIFIIISLPALLADTPLNLDPRWLWPTAVIIVGVLIAGSTLRPRSQVEEQLEAPESGTV